jgi:SanA protein
MKKKTVHIIKQTLITGVSLSFILILLADYEVNAKTKKLVYSNPSLLPYNRVGILLGTSKYTGSGKPNQYFSYRILATVKLYRLGKIKKIVVSGDNSRKDYNEPRDMQQELMKRGIPKKDIYLDYAGFSTFESIYRMHAIFGQRRFTVISQRFHNQRAIFIGKSLGLRMVGYNATDVDAYYGFMTGLREKFARVKLFLDITRNNKPTYLGKKILIE